MSGVVQAIDRVGALREINSLGHIPLSLTQPHERQISTRILNGYTSGSLLSRRCLIGLIMVAITLTVVALVFLVSTFFCANTKGTYTGTIRGRLWVNVIDGNQRGVLVTVKGTSCFLNVPLVDAIRQNVITVTPVRTKEKWESHGSTFNYEYLEISSGGYTVEETINGKLLKLLAEPKDIENATLVLSADRTAIQEIVLSNKSIQRAPTSAEPTFPKKMASEPPFNKVSNNLSKDHTPESQKIRTESW